MKMKYVVAAGWLAVGVSCAAWSADTGANAPAEPGAGQTPSPRAPYTGGLVKGYRGVAVPLPWYQVLFVEKGDRLDVFVTFEAKMKDGSKEKVTATILQNVVAVNVKKADKVDDGLGVIELLLNPNEAQYIALALKQGEVHVASRAADDTEMKPMEMASFRKLFR
ncbi:MAG: RcpC/CpaB family pilus assembly protein [Elusimicrobia bacterium]|nr:RcpC/CpaB family pilus assembly protein [Elusimicrobiota bacterium]